VIKVIDKEPRLDFHIEYRRGIAHVVNTTYVRPAMPEEVAMWRVLGASYWTPIVERAIQNRTSEYEFMMDYLMSWKMAE
jgi:hypothetical protein